MRIALKKWNLQAGYPSSWITHVKSFNLTIWHYFHHFLLKSKQMIDLMGRNFILHTNKKQLSNFIFLPLPSHPNIIASSKHNKNTPIDCTPSVFHGRWSQCLACVRCILSWADVIWLQRCREQWGVLSASQLYTYLHGSFSASAGKREPYTLRSLARWLVIFQVQPPPPPPMTLIKIPTVAGMQARLYSHWRALAVPHISLCIYPYVLVSRASGCST